METTETAAAPSTGEARKKPFYMGLGFQLIVAIVAGVLLGHVAPSWGESMRPLGLGFVKLVKTLIAPIVFCLVVHGIGGVGNVRQVGRMGLKALVYFEVQTTFALILGIVVMGVMHPGTGLNIDPATLDASSIKGIAGHAQSMSGVVGWLMHIIPDTFVSAFAEGQILQVLFLAILFSFALSALGDAGKPLLQVIDLTARCLFGGINYIMKVAPIGAFGAMAFTIGRYGVGSLGSLAYLIVTYYVAAVLFVVICLGGAARAAGFNLFRFALYIKDEILLVLGTSSSEAALPRLMVKLEKLGIPQSVVGLVVPTGYTFNLDGTCINLTVLAVFIAQATNTHLSLGDEVALLAVLLLTSKGAASVTGGSLVVLTATLASTNLIPVAGVALILGIYQFISVGGAIVNALGNGVAAVVVARWEGTLDLARLNARLAAGPTEEMAQPSVEVAAAFAPEHAEVARTS